MSSVPNIVGIKLSDVTAVVGGSSLNGAFTNSVDVCFNATYKGNKDRLSNFRDYNTDRAQLAIGDAYGGGLITYIFQPGDPGYVAGEQHGLIAFLYDLQYNSQNLLWQITNSYLGVTNTALGAGAYNSWMIHINAPDDNTAARQCELWNLSYSDWFLPSRIELTKLINLWHLGLGDVTTADVNLGAGSTYWSSSEWDFTRAWYVYISASMGFTYSDYGVKSGLRRVRPFRYF